MKNGKPAKLPCGIREYAEVRNEGYAYVDKTAYIEKLEQDSLYITFHRPRRFGKSLFVSTLEAYYDTRFEKQFDNLFSGTYIGRHPTAEHNTYSVLTFDFSGLVSDDMDTLRVDMYDSVAADLADFIEAHGLEKKVSLKLEEKPENKYPSKLLRSFFTLVKKHVKEHPFYILIDEYDHFANRILGKRINDFRTMVSDEGFVRTFYEIIKNSDKKGCRQTSFPDRGKPGDSRQHDERVCHHIAGNPLGQISCHDGFLGRRDTAAHR